MLSPIYVRSICIAPELSMICSSPFVVMVVVVGDWPNVNVVIPVLLWLGITNVRPSATLIDRFVNVDV